AGHTVVARAPDGSVLGLQVDANATHPDGSLRHAVITARLPTLSPAGSELALFAALPTPPAPALGAAELLATPFDATVTLALAGMTYTASARALLKAGAAPTWLAGPLATELTLVAPFAAGGSAHPHLSARFDVRAYAGL